MFFASENRNKFLPETFLSHQKRIFPMDIFFILQHSGSVCLPCKWFLVRANGGKQQNYKKLKQIRYFNIANIAECWCGISCTSEGSVINQSWSTHFLVDTFFQMALFVSWTTYMSLRRVKKLAICEWQCFCLFDTQKWSASS